MPQQPTHPNRSGGGSNIPRLKEIFEAIVRACEAFRDNNLVQGFIALLPLKQRPVLVTVLLLIGGTGGYAYYYYQKSGRYLNYAIGGILGDAGFDVVTIPPAEGPVSGTGVHFRTGERHGRAQWRVRFLDWFKDREPPARVLVLIPGKDAKVYVGSYTANHSEVERAEFVAPNEAEGFSAESSLHFAFDREALEPDDHEALAVIADTLRKHRHLSLLVEGHADIRGTVSYNARLAARRAAVVVDALIREGISPNRLVPVSFGEGNPVSSGESEPAHMQNRRADFIFIPSAVLR